MAVEPNTDHSPSNEVEQKYLEEESDEYDSEVRIAFCFLQW